jgi:hypothetical protein
MHGTGPWPAPPFRFGLTHAMWGPGNARGGRARSADGHHCSESGTAVPGRISQQAPLASRAGAVAPAPSACIGVHRWFQRPAFPARRTRPPQRLAIITRHNPMHLTVAAIPARPAAPRISHPRQDPTHQFAPPPTPPRAARPPPSPRRPQGARRCPHGRQDPCTNSRRRPPRRGPRRPCPPRRRHQRCCVIRTVGKTPCTCSARGIRTAPVGQHPMPSGVPALRRREAPSRRPALPRPHAPVPRGPALRRVRWAPPHAQRSAVRWAWGGALSSRAAPSHAPGNETLVRRPARAASPEPAKPRTRPHWPAEVPGHAGFSPHGPPSRRSGNETFVRRAAPGGAGRPDHPRPRCRRPSAPGAVARGQALSCCGGRGFCGWPGRGLGGAWRDDTPVPLRQRRQYCSAIGASCIRGSRRTRSTIELRCPGARLTVDAAGTADPEIRPRDEYLMAGRGITLIA